MTKTRGGWGQDISITITEITLLLSMICADVLKVVHAPTLYKGLGTQQLAHLIINVTAR